MVSTRLKLPRPNCEKCTFRGTDLKRRIPPPPPPLAATPQCFLCGRGSWPAVPAEATELLWGLGDGGGVPRDGYPASLFKKGRNISDRASLQLNHVSSERSVTHRPAPPSAAPHIFRFCFSSSGHDVTADVPVDGEDEDRVGREEAQCRHRELLPSPCLIIFRYIAPFLFAGFRVVLAAGLPASPATSWIILGPFATCRREGRQRGKRTNVLPPPRCGIDTQMFYPASSFVFSPADAIPLRC